jgi:exodeoxyribonuclease VII large subunit
MSKPFTVTELNESIKNILQSNFGLIYVSGDVSNMKLSNNHLYLSLKDSTSLINIVYWNCNDSITNIKNGDEVIISGYINSFIKYGSYQIVAKSIEKIGIGLLYENYIKSKDTFEKKGWFNKSIVKKNIPNIINNIAILTSVEGAALQDILYVLQNNNYDGKIFIKNCLVQGNKCASSICSGIKYFNKLHKKTKIDVLIIARGGGSFEDLIEFSAKQIVRKINKTKIYTISAIGHETDNMLSDYAADLRAPTPSIAAEMITTANKYKLEKINNVSLKLSEISNLIKYKLNNLFTKIDTNNKLLLCHSSDNLINKQIDFINNIKNKIKDNILNKINNYFVKINKLVNLNNNYDNEKILNNGYSLIVASDNTIISTKNDFIKNQKLGIKIYFKDGFVNI